MRRALVYLAVLVAALVEAAASAGIANRPNWLLVQPAPSPPPRDAQAMAYDTGRGRIVLFGGANESGGPDFADTWEWDGSAWIERTTSVSPQARFGHTMVYDSARGRVVLFGGANFQTGLAFADTWEWDGSKWADVTPATSPPARHGQMMAYDSARQRIVVFGGAGESGELSDTWEWDGINWTQRTPATGPPARQYGALAYDAARGRAVLFGGAVRIGDTENFSYFADTWEWDGSTWTDRAPVTNPPGREWHAMAFDAARGRTVLFGGYDGTDGFNDVWEWDGDGWLETAPGASPSPRVVASMVFDSGRARAVLFGGYDGRAAVGDLWEWDGSSWVERTPTTSAPSRSNHAVAFDDARGKTVLFGGYADGPFLADTWEWDGNSWAQKTPETSPPSRIFPAMAYDRARGKTILFGGFGQHGPVDDTWAWDGSNWTQLSPDASPPPRHGHTMVYDAVRERIVLFGGSNGFDKFGDTWEWDGSNWIDVTPATGPEARYRHAMAYDAARQRVVMFGGCTEPLCQMDDTWEWDGSSWVQKTPTTSPTGRLEHAMAYDAGRERVVMFGGFVGSDTAGDTWEWDGNDWTDASASSSPPPRFHHSMSYDGVSGRVLLFGGFNGTYLGDNWEFGPIVACGNADRVIAFAPGSGEASATADAALGPQDGTTVDLGIGGQVDLGLDSTVQDGAGTDFIVHATGTAMFRVEAGEDQDHYVFIRDCLGECQLELEEVGLAQASYLRITALSPDVGAQIDAVSAIHAEGCGNRLPLADAGPDQVLECTGGGVANASLDGSSSSDPDSTPGTSDGIAGYTWTEDGQTLATAVTASVPFALGVHDVTLTVTDQAGATASDVTRVTVEDTTPPTIACPANIRIECQTDGSALVHLPPATVDDACLGTATITNDHNGGGADASGTYPLGTTTVIFMAQDAGGNIAACSTSISVADTTPPVITVNATPGVVWPPNHRMLSVRVTVVVNDACDPSPLVELQSVASSDPDDAPGAGDGATRDDIQGATLGTADVEFSVRSERDFRKAARTYSARYVSTDASGNVATGVGTIVVRPDPRQIRPADGRR